jgi:hypothetical protein
MLLLPEPFGPTMTLTPGENSSVVRSGKDLKPFIEIDFRYTAAHLASPECSRSIRTRRRLD